MKIKVTCKDIKNSYRGNPGDCAVANTIKKIIDNKYKVYVGYSCIRIEDDLIHHYIDINKELTEFILKFDKDYRLLLFKSLFKSYIFDLPIEPFLPKPVFTEITEPSISDKELDSLFNPVEELEECCI